MRAGGMNFFERQRQARSASRRLVLLFALAVLGIVASIDLALLLLAPGNGLLLWGVNFAVVALIGVSSLVRIAMLSSGGAEVARAIGARPVPEDTRDPALRRLRNVVEEIAIASGVPVPEIHVLEKEDGINAFAAGYAPSDAVVAVTRGALKRLDREELQGVIAHEFSHILNGDMRLNIRLMGVLFGLLVVGIVGRRILEHVRSERDSNTQVILGVGLILTLAGYAGLFCGRLIKAGVSRSREYLADASAVQFTRQSRGLAGALKKIAGLPAGSRLNNTDAEEVSHMLFGEGLDFSGWFATHPPILERIKAIEPDFDAAQLARLKAHWAAHPPRIEDEAENGDGSEDGSEAEAQALGLAAVAGRQHVAAAPPATPPATLPATLPGAGTRLEISAPAVAARVGAPELEDFHQAGRITGQLSLALQQRARSPAHAIEVVLGLLLGLGPEPDPAQLDRIGQALGPDTAAAVRKLHPQLAALHPMLRLPLAALAFPALRRQPRAELLRFLRCCEQLIAGDGRVSFSEYCLGRLLRSQTIEALNPKASAAASGQLSLARTREAVALLLAVLAQQGHTCPDAARRAYTAGMARVLPHWQQAYAPPQDFVVALEWAWPQLDRIAPDGKALLIEGMVTAIALDSRLSLPEAELLRIVCALLHCPLPPFLPFLPG